MNNFTYSDPTKAYFGTGSLAHACSAELSKFGQSILLAYGGRSVKRSGVYDEVRSALEAAGKTVIDFSGIMPNPTYAKVQEGCSPRP